MSMRFLLLALLLVGACATERRTIDGRLTDNERREPMLKAKDVGAPCRLYVVPAVPPGMRRLGSIRVKAALAADQRVDDDSREYACDLKATHAVKEQEGTDRKMGKVWILGLYGE